MDNIVTVRNYLIGNPLSLTQKWDSLKFHTWYILHMYLTVLDTS